MPGRVVEVIVDPDDDVQDGRILDRRGDDHALGAALQMPLQGCGRQELAGAFEHNIDAEIAPGEIARSSMRRKAQLAIVDPYRGVPLVAEISPPAALHAVEFQQVRRRQGTALDFVEVNNIEAIAAPGVTMRPLGRAQGRPERQASDPPHAVDANPHTDPRIRPNDNNSICRLTSK